MSKKKPHAPEDAAETATAPAEDLAPLLAERDARIEKLQGDLLYEKAEVENFKRRTEKRYQDLIRFASEPLIRDLLGVLDNLERAAEHLDSADAASFAEGLGHITEQFRQALYKNGVSPIAAEGEKFDPNLHEALAQVAGPEDNKVMAVHEKGYLLHERLLRPSRVLVSRLASPQCNG